MRNKRRPDFLDFVCVLLIVMAAVLVIGGVAHSSDDTPRYTVVKPEQAVQVATPALKPVAETVALPDTRPVVAFYVSAEDLKKPVAKWHCTACRQCWQAIERGELYPWSFKLEAAPNWVAAFPTFHFTGQDNESWYYPRSTKDWDGIKGFERSFRARNPKFSTVQVSDATPAESPGPQPTPPNTAPDQNAVEQFRKFAGDSGRLTFTPDTPIRTTMDDGTTIAYRSITGKYDYNNGKPTLTLDGDKPQMSARKFLMKFGLTLNDVAYDPPSSVSVGTSRGRFTIQLKESK